ncbi:hypothetical protein DUT91_13305 [Phyllobacterium salinisoli]|uniref:Uncharacterized protein n=1 Tax=Phyllobacterium salinisoli TaxID=1899321 RepID=A0A368K4G5_9HYPH|nr:hypothetical protein [Phyllobacterium salinisoli]RCS23535.1 hypothetical protein DUT91_13305 [Phyllobacterium salinisoli]
MKHFSAPRVIAALAVLAGATTAHAASLPMTAPLTTTLLTRVAGDCVAIGQRVASEQGGTLTKATPSVQNGKDMCVVVVLVPGRDGERPRRVEVAVPAN